MLRNLPADAIARLQLRRITLPAHKSIEISGEPIPQIFFLEAGAASVTASFVDGSQVEVGLLGFESVLCVSALMGTRRSLNRVYMQIAGHGYAAPIASARSEFLRNEQFQFLVLRNVQAHLAQVAQSAGCNAKHELEQRLARWLLLCADRAGTDTMEISHNFLATMLGVRRMSAGAVVAHFKKLGLIDHQRSLIRICDFVGLEKKACECYRTVKQYLDNVTEFDNGFVQ